MHKEQLLDDSIFLVHGFLSPEECEAFIARAEDAGFGDATVNSPSGPVVQKRMRSNERAIIDDPALASELWQRAAGMIPETQHGWRALCLNERFRFYRYDVGQEFGLHIDGPFVRHANEQSFLTFMVYLNDGFEGGEPVFIEPGSGQRVEITRAVPRAGTALVFRHPFLHEGSKVTSGRKYVLRSDVMYVRG